MSPSLLPSYFASTRNVVCVGKNYAAHVKEMARVFGDEAPGINTNAKAQTPLGHYVHLRISNISPATKRFLALNTVFGPEDSVL